MPSHWEFLRVYAVPALTTAPDERVVADPGRNYFDAPVYQLVSDTPPRGTPPSHVYVKHDGTEVPVEAHLSELGTDGWELVAVVALGAMREFYLKRRRDS